MNIIVNNKTGNINDFKPIVKINDNKYVISWGLSNAYEDIYNWNYFTLDYKPSIKQLKDIIETYINENTKYSIVNNFYWNGMQIYLSVEKQLNYKLLYEITKIKNGDNLPVSLKFSINRTPYYYTFETISDLEDFIINMYEHISQCLMKGNSIKESIDYDLYI